MNYGQNGRERPNSSRSGQGNPPDRRAVRDPRVSGGNGGRTPAGRPSKLGNVPRSPANARPRPQGRRPAGQAYSPRPAGRSGYYGRGRYGQPQKNGAAYAVIAVLLLVIVVSLVSIIRSCSIARADGGAGDVSADTSASGAVSAPGTEIVTDDADQSVSIMHSKEKGKIRICVDPGHGYDDGGAQSPYLGSKNEEDINLAVAEKLVPLLMYEGYDVIMTRESDTPPATLKPNKNGQYLIEPKWRSEFANRNETDLYISLHCNSFDDASVSGTRLYYYSGSTYGSDSLAAKLSTAMAGTFNIAPPKAIGMDSSTAYTVTRLVKAPSVLVEMGFITNKSDAANLLDENWQTQMARAIARGIKDYLSAE